MASKTTTAELFVLALYICLARPIYFVTASSHSAYPAPSSFLRFQCIDPRRFQIDVTFSGQCLIAFSSGWNETESGVMSPFDESLYSPRCDLERRKMSTLSMAEFQARYAHGVPVVLIDDEGEKHGNGCDHSPRTEAFRRMTQRQTLLRFYENATVILSTANKNSYEKRTTTFKTYVEAMDVPQDVSATGASTMYHFGNNKHDEWPELFRSYIPPKKYIRDRQPIALSFGLAGSGTGVPFHTHGAVFAEVSWGMKRWFLKAPGPEPEFDPDGLSLVWLRTVYPHMD
eukprot:PhM_4_TR1451/c0_g2_i1/m.8845